MVAEGVKRALSASILSRGWAAALSLLAVPFYLRFIGVEAYGVVGLFLSFSVLVGFLDLGLGATLTRELARLGPHEARSRARDMVRTFEIVYALVALLIAAVIVACSGPVAHHWIQAESLGRAEISRALALAGIALACQWPANLYAAGLAGVHRQIQLAAATSLFATLRVVLTLVAVWWKPNLESFFWAQILSALIQSIGMRWLLWRSLALQSHRPRVRFSIVESSLSFAGGVTGIAITSVMLTQTDKLVLSRALSLSEFGAYSVAAVLATGLYMLISPMYSVMYPRFSSLIHGDARDQLTRLYHTGSQAMAALVFPIAAVFSVFSSEILLLWTSNPELSHRANAVLSLLILGNSINGLMNLPFALQMAHGWTSLALKLNVIFIVTLIPAMWLAASEYGAVGGAAVWLVLNMLCFALVPYLMHRKLLAGQLGRWYLYSAAVPFLVCAALILPIIFWMPERSSLGLLFCLLASWAAMLVALGAALPDLRAALLGVPALNALMVSVRRWVFS